MVVDGIDTTSALNERLLCACVCELEIRTCSIYCRLMGGYSTSLHTSALNDKMSIRERKWSQLSVTVGSIEW